MTYRHLKCPIGEMSFIKRIGKYLMSVKVGNYYEFTSFIYSNQEHHHDCYEFVIVLDGQGQFIYKEKERLLKKRGGHIFVRAFCHS